MCAKNQYPQFSLSHLSPVCVIPDNHLLVVFKSYFDGGRDAQDGQITLAGVSGSSEQWDAFEVDWRAVLDHHKAPFLHTTDAVALKDRFAGWKDDKIDAFITDCVVVIGGHMGVANLTQVLRHGLLPVTLSIKFDDFRKARAKDGRLPNSISDICVSESVSFAFRWGKLLGADWYHLYFDQGEDFFGHIYDRKHNKKAKRDIGSMSKVVHLGESDSRLVPALQMADLFAWCINHNDRVVRRWHGLLHALPWMSLTLDEHLILQPQEGVLERIAEWKLPPRRPT